MDPTTWDRAVVRIGEIPNPLFRNAAGAPKLCAAYDALIGPGRWLTQANLCTFPIRSPNHPDL